MTRSGWQNESGGSQHAPNRRLVAGPCPQARLFPPSAETPGQDVLYNRAEEESRIATDTAANEDLNK
jgi:hypothetical protein